MISLIVFKTKQRESFEKGRRTKIVKPGKNSILLKNDKTVIIIIVQVENLKFFLDVG